MAAATVQGPLATDAPTIDALDPQPNPPHPQPNDFQSEIDSLTSLLNHPKKMLKQIPRLSRVSTARKLASVIEQVVSRNDVPSWVRLLSFSKKCLCTPIRGGKRWSLATLINRQVSQETPGVHIPVSQPPSRLKTSKKHNPVDQLATRVSSWRRVTIEGQLDWPAVKMLLLSILVEPLKP